MIVQRDNSLQIQKFYTKNQKRLLKKIIRFVLDAFSVRFLEKSDGPTREKPSRPVNIFISGKVESLTENLIRAFIVASKPNSVPITSRVQERLPRWFLSSLFGTRLRTLIVFDGTSSILEIICGWTRSIIASNGCPFASRKSERKNDSSAQMLPFHVAWFESCALRHFRKNWIDDFDGMKVTDSGDCGASDSGEFSLLDGVKIIALRPVQANPCESLRSERSRYNSDKRIRQDTLWL